MKLAPTTFKEAEQGKHNPNQKFSIAPEAFDAIMEILSGMYPDILFAVAREYVTNAYDANQASGTSNPIEIRIENEDFIGLDGERKAYGVFEVKDYGPGMDYDDIQQVYTQYGISSKKDTNEFAGGFGIGSKSVFALTKYFEIISVKNGNKLGVSFVLEDEEGAFFDIMLEERTDEPNGVTVRIPLKDSSEVRRMKETTAELFITWPLGSYTVNGEIPEEQKRLHDETKFLPINNINGETVAWVSLNSHIEQTAFYQETNEERRKKGTYYPTRPSGFFSSRGKEKTYMGGAFYSSPVDTVPKYNDYSNSTIYKFYQKHEIVWNLPIGFVKITPDRTAIKVTSNNISKIKEFQQQVWDSLPDFALQHATTLKPAEAERWLAANRNLLLNQPLNDVVLNDRFYTNTYTVSQLAATEKAVAIDKGKASVFHLDTPLYRSSVYGGYSAISDTPHHGGRMINVLIWGNQNDVTGGSYRDVLPAVRETVQRYVDSDDLFCLHVFTDQKPSPIYSDGWVVLHVDQPVELRKTFNARISKYRTPTPKQQEVFYGSTPDKPIGKLEAETIVNAENIMYVQECQVANSREWLEAFTRKNKYSATANLVSKVFKDRTVVMLPNNRSPRSVMKLNPNIEDFYVALQRKIDAVDPEFMSLIHYVSRNWKIREGDSLPAHSSLAEAITEIRKSDSELRMLALLVDLVPEPKDGQEKPVTLPPRTPLVDATASIMENLVRMNVVHFNKLLELYPEVTE